MWPQLQLRKLNSVIELIKVLIWPLVIVLGIAIYSAEINRAFSIVLDKIEVANNVTIGSLRIEINEKAENAGLIQLGDKLTTLSRPALVIFFRMNEDSLFTQYSKEDGLMLFPHSENRNALYELDREGLILMPIEKAELESFILNVVVPVDKDINSFWQNYSLNRELTNAEIQKFDKLAFKITKKGKEANKLVVDVLAQYLTR